LSEIGLDKISEFSLGSNKIEFDSNKMLFDPHKNRFTQVLSGGVFTEA